MNRGALAPTIVNEMRARHARVLSNLRTRSYVAWPMQLVMVMATQNRNWRRALTGGLIGGIVGGIVLALIMLGLAWAQGMNPWTAAKVAGAPFLRERALSPGFDGLAVLVGLLSHFAVSMFWGALFGLIFFGLGKGATLAAGAVWGVVVWLVMFYAVLPVLGLGALATQQPMGLAIAEHVFFGLGVGLGFLPFQERIAPARRGRPITAWR